MRLLSVLPALAAITTLCSSAAAEWGPWSDWSSCSRACDGGLRTRDRQCVAAPCEGLGVDQVTCNQFACHCNANTPLCQCVDDVGKCPGWGWSKTKNRCERNGKTTLEDLTARGCFNMPVNGGWSEWANDGLCSATCGQGTQRLARTCTVPAPANGGKPCPGSNKKTTDCMSSDNCAADTKNQCVWNVWSEWSSCDCTASMQGSVRLPQNPDTCATILGTRAQACTCNANELCVWSNWTEWGECDCDTKQAAKTRAPMSGMCGADDTMYQACACTADDSTPNCLWQPWSDWSPCDCAKKETTSDAKSGSDACPADEKSRAKACSCDTTCTWADWSEWGLCECLEEQQSRTHASVKGSCSNPAAIDSRSCNCTATEWGIWVAQHPEVADSIEYVDDSQDDGATTTTTTNGKCSFSDWSQWTACDCNALTMESTRKALNTACPRAFDSRTTSCFCDGTGTNGGGNSKACQWSAWGSWSICDCSTNRTSSTRAPLHGTSCGSGQIFREQACACDASTPNGGCSWQPWSEWSTCNCDVFIATSTRAPVDVGRCASGPQARTQPCPCTMDERFPVVVRFTLDGSIDDFDRADFITTLADLLGVTSNTIDVRSVVSGSVIVTAGLSVSAANALDAVDQAALQNLGDPNSGYVMIKTEYITDGRSNTANKPSGSGGSSSLSSLGIGLVAAGATVGAAGIVGLGFGLLVWTRRRRERASVGSRDSAKLEWEASTDALQPPNLPGYHAYRSAMVHVKHTTNPLFTPRRDEIVKV